MEKEMKSNKINTFFKDVLKDTELSKNFKYIGTLHIQGADIDIPLSIIANSTDVEINNVFTKIINKHKKEKYNFGYFSIDAVKDNGKMIKISNFKDIIYVEFHFNKNEDDYYYDYKVAENSKYYCYDSKNLEFNFAEYTFLIDKKRVLNIDFKTCSKYNVDNHFSREKFSISADKWGRGYYDIDRGGQCQCDIFKDISTLHETILKLDKFHLKAWKDISEQDKVYIIKTINDLCKAFEYIKSSNVVGDNIKTDDIIQQLKKKKNEKIKKKTY